MNYIEVLGFTAGILTTFSAAPQLYYSYKTKDVASIDLKFQTMLISGLFLWTIYGISIHSLPVIVFNAIGVLLWLPIFWMKIKGPVS